MTSKYPPEKVSYRVALNADAESTQAQSSSSATQAGWTFEQTYMYAQTGHDGPPPPSYNESIAAYHDPQVMQAARLQSEKAAVQGTQDYAAIREGNSSLSSSAASHITPFPFPLPQSTALVATTVDRAIPADTAPTVRTSPPAITVALASVTPVASAVPSVTSISSAAAASLANAAPSPYSAPPPPSQPPSHTAYLPPSGYTLPEAASNTRDAGRSAPLNHAFVQIGPPAQRHPYAFMDPHLDTMQRSTSDSSSSRASPRPGLFSADSIANGLRSLAPGASPSEILTPPPPSFSRPLPSNLPYTPFLPCAVLSFSGQLDDGFPAIAPTAMVQPHPFATHDVNETDWTLFLSHVKMAGSLSPINRVVAGVAPAALGIGLVGGLFLSMGIEAQMKQRKTVPVAEIIDQWNFNFFYPRQMEITLAQGQERHSGLGSGPPPDVVAAQNGQGGSYPSPILSKSVSFSKGSMSDEDDSSDEDSPSLYSKVGLQMGSREKRMDRKEAKKARKAEKRARKAEKRAARAAGGYTKRDMWGSSEESWRLVVSFRQPVL